MMVQQAYEIGFEEGVQEYKEQLIRYGLATPRRDTHSLWVAILISFFVGVVLFGLYQTVRLLF